MSEKWKMPTPAETLKAIDEWRRLDINSVKKEQVQGEFKRVFSKILGVFQGETTIPGYSTFFRLREFDYLIGHVDELWAPPPSKTKKGRCNFDQEPVLYVSTDGANCFDELNVQLEQQVYLIRYEKKIGSLSLRSAYGTDWASIGLAEQIFETENDSLSYQILREFLRSEFMKPTCRNCEGSNFIYNVTASICSFLRSVPNVDGFVYPSAVNLFSPNVALFPETAKQKLNFKDVRILKLVSREPIDGRDGVSYETRFNGIIDGEKVSWTSRSGTGSFHRMTAKAMGQ